MTSNTKPQLNIQGREVVRSRKEGAGDTSPERKNVLEFISQKNKKPIYPTSKKPKPTDTACMFPTQAQYLLPVGIKKPRQSVVFLNSNSS